MVLTLYTHPLASYWHKGLIALYELPLGYLYKSKFAPSNSGQT